MLPSRSITRLCGKRSVPAPKLLSSLPEASNSSTGASALSAQELAPQRSATQMWPSRSRSTALVEPQARPSGILKKFSMVRYGFGCELGAAPGWARAAARAMIGTAASAARRFTMGMTAPPDTLFHSAGGACFSLPKLSSACHLSLAISHFPSDNNLHEEYQDCCSGPIPAGFRRLGG